MQIFTNINIDFIGKRKIALIFSAILILIGIVSLVIQRGPNYGIDFLGGTSMALSFQEPVDIASIRSAVSSAGFGNAEIKRFGSDKDVLIRVQQQETHSEISDVIKSRISESLPNNPYQVQMVETVGPKIGSELREKALFAILIALFFILLYISWRFEFVFAVGAIIALFHDVLITLGVFSVLRLEVSLAIIAAFLTIVGYSLNDTIVVFDRIRENLKVLRREAYDQIINRSINQSLSRTVVTSLTTLIVVVILFVFGGEVIHNFAFALMVGVIVGTYSSVFIASPILVEWQLKKESKKAKSHGKRVA